MTDPEGFAPLVTSRRSGTELIHLLGKPLEWTISDFWSWSTSDLLSNAARGRFAEFLVAIAIGKADGLRAEWDAYDLITPSGIKIEVKSAAYLQSWYHKKLSSIKFGIQPTREWLAATNELATEIRRQSDVYVFAVLEHQDKATVDPTDLTQWRFYVLPTSILNDRCPTQKSIILSSLLKLGPTIVSFAQLGQAIADGDPRLRPSRPQKTL